MSLYNQKDGVSQKRMGYLKWSRPVIEDDEKTLKGNTIKSGLATMPNAIQSLDANVLHMLISMCRKNKLPLGVIYDAILTSANFIDIIRDYYFGVVVDLSQFNPLKHMLSVNLLDDKGQPLNDATCLFGKRIEKLCAKLKPIDKGAKRHPHVLKQD